MAINIGKNADGDVTYQNPPVNRTLFPNIKYGATPEEIQEAVDAWLDDHPEATTTVEDGSILPVKLDSTNEATDGYVLSYNATAGKFEWYNIGAELDDINSDITDLKQDLNRVKDLSKEEIDYIYQFVDPTDLTERYYWSNNNGTMVKTGNNGTNCYEAITLYPGIYTVLDTIAAYLSFVDDGTSITTFKEYYETDDRFSGDITITDTLTLYISLLRNYSQQTRIINKTTLTFIVPYENGLVYGELNHNIKSSNTSYYDQAFIKNGELTCNNDHVTSSNTIAKYTQVDMQADIKKVMCEGYFQASGASSSITLVATNLDTYSNVGNIIYGCIHIGFTPSSCAVEIFVNRSKTTVETFTYTALTLNTKYVFGWEINDDTITVYLPDGTTQTVTDERFSSLNGKYLIFEHYKADSGSNPPTDSFNPPIITGIYCKCDGKPTLRDNFKRNDGAPNCSPTGHVYVQYRNTDGDSEDTIFDNEAGST